MRTKPNTPLTKTGMLLKFLVGSKRFFLVSILASMCVTGLDMLTPQIIRSTIDSVIGSEPFALPGPFSGLIDGAVLIDFVRQNLYVVAIAIVVIGLLVALFRYLNQLFNSKGGESLMESMRNQLFAHIQKLPFAWHMKNQTGDIIQRCTSDVDMVRNFISGQLTSMLRVVIMISFSLVVMFSMNAKLGGIAAAFMPIIVAYSAIFHGRISKHFTECDENEGILSTIAQENLTGVRVVRAFGRENYERERFEKQNIKYTNLWVKLCKLLAYFWGCGDLASGLQVMLVIVFGAVFCANGQMTAGEFVAFISYNAMLVWPVRSLGRMISEMSKAGVSIARIHYIMASEPEVDKEDAIEPELAQDIVFDHVSFGYDPGVEILKDVSFTIPKGSVFGIIGGTGSGKSTLMHLLNRLYELPEGCGKITIGGVDIAAVKASWLRKNIGMVLQEPFLFSRTIAENIGITRPGMGMDEIRKAASIACVDEAITEFAKGYDTIVGERGVTLSGGQKQRTAIARMLTQNTPIMIFDDSLSAVDAETDVKIRTALKQNMGDATVILISHRITTLMHARQILVLDKGRVAQLGSHDELMKDENGIYAKIYNMQMQMPEELKEGA